SGIKTEHSSYGLPNELQQVFLVILNNAIDILVSKKISNPKITIDIEQVDGCSVIKIKDNAGGMSTEIQEKIFEPYYTTKHKSQGTGLGLYISKIIVEDSLGGTLKVQTNATGACFIIKLKVSHE
ncbi:MAG: histidine kinase, partial [Epsilonproteobacteria bacterium]